MWDWYSIGGRWPEMFLVKIPARSIPLVKEAGAIQIERRNTGWICGFVPPEKISHGKRCGAGEIRKQRALYKLEQMFLAGKTDSDFYGEIVPDGVIRWGRYVYRKALHWKNTLRSMGFQATGSTR